MDQAGIFSHNVEDASILLQSIAGFDQRDSTSAKVDIPNYFENLSDNLNGKTVGIPKEYSIDGTPQEISQIWQDAVKVLEKKGVKIKNISLPNTTYALPAYYIVAPAEASSNLARYDGVKYGHRAKGKNIIEVAKSNIARLINLNNENIILTSSATESINLLFSNFENIRIGVCYDEIRKIFSKFDVDLRADTE